MTERTGLPDFEVPATGNQRFQLSALKGHPIVLCFYPKDDTPGCTTEGQQFRDLDKQFLKLKVPVFGISRDSVASHERVRSIFDVMKMKKLYGRDDRVKTAKL